MNAQYNSEAAEAIHESAQDLYEIGAISKDRMREFDEMCLVQKDETPTYEVENPQVLEHATA